MQFEYRSSRIKRQTLSKANGARHTPYVVLAATFQVTPADPTELSKRADGFNDYRRRTQPPGASMGSMFKNPPDDAAGRLIDQCGLKGTRVGDAEISTVHANFFVNHGWLLTQFSDGEYFLWDLTDLQQPISRFYAPTISDKFTAFAFTDDEGALQAIRLSAELLKKNPSAGEDEQSRKPVDVIWH